LYQNRTPSTSPWATRAIWWALAVVALSVIAVARALEPDPRGFGTHTQLGLPPCGFAQLTGLGCPSCGLTTSFAHMARGQLAEGWSAHALGPLLFALLAACVPLGVVAGTRGWPISVTLQRLRARLLAVIIAVAALAFWFVRTIFQLG
jgi:hypothetical protein